MILTNLRTKFTLENEPEDPKEALYNFEVTILTETGSTEIKDTIFAEPLPDYEIHLETSIFMKKVFGAASTLEQPLLCRASGLRSFQPHLACIENDNLRTFYLTSKDVKTKGLKLVEWKGKYSPKDYLWNILTLVYEDKLVDYLFKELES